MQQIPAVADSPLQCYQQPFRVLLVSAPWAPANRPSVQVAALSGFLQKHGGIEVQSRHGYLDIASRIGSDRYGVIARSGWAGEAVFSALLFPTQRDRAARVFRAEFKKHGGSSVVDFEELVDVVRRSCDTLVDESARSHPRLVGFSVCFNQLLASLYLADRFKAQTDALVVFGGTSCAGQVGRSLIERFSQIDYLIDGEGERPLLELCRCLQQPLRPLPAQVRTRHDHCTGPPTASIERLDELPFPDYRPYLAEVRRHFNSIPFTPVLPIEFSRGCTWRRCAFCNLNLQWRGYRSKSAKRMAAEVQALSAACESLLFSFTDNVLPQRAAKRFFQQMAQTGHDHDFFGELRAGTPPDQLALYRRGGLRTVQVGIEALSNSLLARMGKGTTVIDNLAMMKHCLAAGIRLTGNLITEFPETSEEEITETLNVLDYVWPYAPLEAASFFLGFDSKIQQRPREYGIAAIVAHHKNRLLFPAHLLGTMLVMGYWGDRRLQRRRWRPVREQLHAWMDFQRHRHLADRPALSYRDGGRFLIIQQDRPGVAPRLHRLRGTAAALYRWCEQPQTFAALDAAFPGLDPLKRQAFINELSDKRLLFHQEDRVLALAIRFHS